MSAGRSGDQGGGGGGSASLPAATKRRRLPDPRKRLPGGDPISDPDPIYQHQADVVYGASHWAFKFLIDRYGEEKVRHVLLGMGRGQSFDLAFERAIGLTADDFEADFKRYVIWQGWR